MPPKPNALTAARRGSRPPRRGQGRAASRTVNGLSSSPAPAGGVRKLAVGGSVACSSASSTLSSPAAPAPVSRWPTLAFTAPSAHCPGRHGSPAHSSLRLDSSMPSPTGVPVAWHSIRSTSAGRQPACRYAARIARNWPSRAGASRPPPRSFDRPMPRMTP